MASRAPTGWNDLPVELRGPIIHSVCVDLVGDCKDRDSCKRMARWGLNLVSSEFSSITAHYQWKHLFLAKDSRLDWLVLVFLPLHRDKVRRLTLSYEGYTDEETVLVASALYSSLIGELSVSYSFPSLAQQAQATLDLGSLLHRTALHVLNDTPNLTHFHLCDLGDESFEGDLFLRDEMTERQRDANPRNGNHGALRARGGGRGVVASFSGVPMRVADNVLREAPGVKELVLQDWDWHSEGTLAGPPLTHLETLDVTQSDIFRWEHGWTSSLRVVRLSDPQDFPVFDLRVLLLQARLTLEEVDLSSWNYGGEDFDELLERPGSLDADDVLLPCLHTLRAPQFVICPALSSVDYPVSRTLRHLILNTPDEIMYDYDVILELHSKSLETFKLDCVGDEPQDWSEMEDWVADFAVWLKICEREKIEFRWTVSSDWAEEQGPCPAGLVRIAEVVD